MAAVQMVNMSWPVNYRVAHEMSYHWLCT